MPELPELTVVQEVLSRRAVGQTIARVDVLPSGGAIVVRDLTRTGFDLRLTGSRITSVARRGKFLVFALARPAAGPSDPPLFLAVNPKLTGRLQLAQPSDKRYAKTHVVFTLSSGEELRYVDQKRMGQIYLTYDLQQVPDYAGMGPEPFDVSLGDFRARLRPFRGEIKGILTRGEFIAGIGNAYADEILWAARIHPYRKRTMLTEEEVVRLYESTQSTLRSATDIVRAEMGDNIYLKPRDFLSVHGKTDQPCPRCGTAISLVSANQRITNFCRKCQPGGLIKGM
ncbi:MAG: Fpg/Nei family DNA glycosylase [Rudaea sp.]